MSEELLNEIKIQNMKIEINNKLLYKIYENLESISKRLNKR